MNITRERRFNHDMFLRPLTIKKSTKHLFQWQGKNLSPWGISEFQSNTSKKIEVMSKISIQFRFRNPRFVVEQVFSCLPPIFFFVNSVIIANKDSVYFNAFVAYANSFG